MKKLLLTFISLFLITGLAHAAEESYTTGTLGSNAWSGNNTTSTFNNVNWTLDVVFNQSSYFANNTDKGFQIGSNSSYAKSILISSNDILGTITKVSINTSGNSKVGCSIGVTVGSTQFTCGENKTTKISASAADYEFTGSASGKIEINWDNTASPKGLYVKSITVYYESDAPGDTRETTVLSWDGETDIKVNLGETATPPPFKLNNLCRS